MLPWTPSSPEWWPDPSETSSPPLTTSTSCYAVMLTSSRSFSWVSPFSTRRERCHRCVAGSFYKVFCTHECFARNLICLYKIHRFIPRPDTYTTIKFLFTIKGVCTWQFNFKFNLSEDMYAEESVDLLQNSGIQFERHEREGIETVHFAEMLIVSGSMCTYTFFFVFMCPLQFC